MTRAVVGFFVGWILFASTAAYRQSAFSHPQPAAERPEADSRSGIWLGTASCSAAACHGGNNSRGSAGSEYMTWLTYDPHARAYEDLLGQLGRQIGANLGITHPEKDNRCLNCHVRPHFNEAEHAGRFSAADGVGCESCHGPARKWLAIHYLDGHKGQRDRDGAGDAPRNLRNLEVRARTCLECHVGARDADVNHDLIAAGHPVLKFEYGVYNANVPRHWRELGENQKAVGADHEARVWLVGQLATAAAALDLAADRAASGVPPEFAEFDCYACHHNLQARSWRQQGAAAGKHLGRSFPWGSWFYPQVKMLANELRRGADVVPQLQKVEQFLGNPLRPAGKASRQEVATAARAAAGQVRGMISEANTAVDPALVRRLLAAETRPPEQDLNWDAAAQRYLAITALELALAQMDPAATRPAVKETLKAMLKTLERPEDFEGRNETKKPEAVFLEQLQLLHKELGR
jgi:hypothetical protein